MVLSRAMDCGRLLLPEACFMKQLLATFFLLATLGCSTTISFEHPQRTYVPELDSQEVGALTSIYALQPMPAILDARLVDLVDVVKWDVDTITVHTGRAVRWAFRHDEKARVRLTLGECRFGKATNLGSLLESNFECTCALYLGAALDGGPPRDLVATGHSSASDPPVAVRRAVENCVEDLYAQIENIIRISPGP
jgi:hypothetical protein